MIVGFMDAMRGRVLAALGSLAPALLRHREPRVAVYGVGAIILALGATFAFPLELLAVGPIVLGVPHLVADVRYLVARPALHRRAEFWLFVAGPAALSFVHPHASLSMAAIAGAALIARGSLVPRLFAFGIGVALVFVCAHFGRTADLVVAHGHNLVAIALFVAWSRRQSSHHLWIVAAFAAGLVAIAFGPARLAESGPLAAGDVIHAIAPFDDSALATRAVLAFAFAQSVHYAVWLRLVPEADRPRPGLRSFASSLRALTADVGVTLVAVAIVVTVAFAAWGCFSIAGARDGYLRLAIFHGPLELGAATLLLLERGQLSMTGGDSGKCASRSFLLIT